MNKAPVQLLESLKYVIQMTFHFREKKNYALLSGCFTPRARNMYRKMHRKIVGRECEPEDRKK